MEAINKSVTGIVVTYNTKDLFRRAYDSVRKFYPKMRMIIVDNSSPTDPCYTFVDKLSVNPYNKVIHTHANVGHGPGMHQALCVVETKYAVVFDSDIVMLKPPLMDMMVLMEPDTFGIGIFDNVCKDGYYHKGDPHALRIPYLHPYFQLIQVENYHKYSPFVHHGSPCIHTMVDIYNRRLSEKILKYFPLDRFIRHDWRGTRRLNPREFLENWETKQKVFMTIVTRKHPKRPKLFRIHRAGLIQQDSQDFEHVILSDPVGRGVHWANGEIFRERHRYHGDYIFILDDDDVLTKETFISDMQKIVDSHKPDVIFLKGIIRDRIYPTDTVWGGKPQFAHIGSFNFIVRKDIWMKHSQAWDVPRGGDFSFINSVMNDKVSVFWKDEIYCQTIVVSRGKPEPEVIEEKKENGISVITCTGDRPEAFALCQKWMERQTKKPDQWIVIDDGLVPLEKRGGIEYFYRNPSPTDPPHTLSKNLPIALSMVAHDKVIIMEDDDWYSPKYIEYMDGLLGRADLVGIENLVFYHIQRRGYIQKGRAAQPPLSQTAFTRKVIPAIENICRGQQDQPMIRDRGLIDMFLWSVDALTVKNVKKVALTQSLKIASGKTLIAGTVFTEPNIPVSIIRRANKNRGAKFIEGNVVENLKKLRVMAPFSVVVGMKGLPGRKGLTSAQNPDNGKFKSDQDFRLLKTLVGSDFEFYKDLGRE